MRPAATWPSLFRGKIAAWASSSWTQSRLHRLVLEYRPLTCSRQYALRPEFTPTCWASSLARSFRNSLRDCRITSPDVGQWLRADRSPPRGSEIIDAAAECDRATGLSGVGG